MHKRTRSTIGLFGHWEEERRRGRKTPVVIDIVIYYYVYRNKQHMKERYKDMMSDMSWLNDYGPELNEAWDEDEEYEDVDYDDYRDSYNDYISSYIY